MDIDYRASTNRQIEIGWRGFQAWLPSHIKVVMKAVFLKYLVSHENFVPNTALGYRNGLKIPLNLPFNINTSNIEFDLV